MKCVCGRVLVCKSVFEKKKLYLVKYILYAYIECGINYHKIFFHFIHRSFPIHPTRLARQILRGSFDQFNHF